MNRKASASYDWLTLLYPHYITFFTANSAKESLLPYLPDILEQIQTCLSTMTVKDEDGDLCLLHTQALGKFCRLHSNVQARLSSFIFF